MAVDRKILSQLAIFDAPAFDFILNKMIKMS
jgi:ribosomal protein L20